MSKEKFFKHEFVERNQDLEESYALAVNETSLYSVGKTWSQINEEGNFRLLEGLFIHKIVCCEIYEVEELLNFHLEYYISQSGEPKKMLKYLQYLFQNIKEEKLYRNMLYASVIGASTDSYPKDDVLPDGRVKSHKSITNIEEGLNWCTDKIEVYNNARPLLNQPTDDNDNKTNPKNLTHKQRVLLIHYFQKFLSFPRADDLSLNNGQFNKFMSLLFDLNEKNTELYFSNIGLNSDYNSMTIPNLQKMLKVFKELKLDEHLSEIEEDLRKEKEKQVRK